MEGTRGSRPLIVGPEWERQLQALVDEFLEQLQAGAEPDAYELLQAHPSLAPELELRLEAASLLYQLAKMDREESEESTSSTSCPDGTDSDQLGSSSQIPCPSAMGRYQIQGTLGQGASATVYQAYDPKHDRVVALKVFRLDAAAGSDAGKRFLRDARIAAQLRHPNIVPLHETGEDAGQHYIDMELVRGETLEARLRRQKGPLDFRQAAILVHKVATALNYAHLAGIVHRDVKPSNILMDEGGEPQLADFDLARRLAGEESLTAQGQILGTPAYMSPEQAEGRSHEADFRSDVYSLGVVFYRMLTGRLPFEDREWHVLLSHIAHSDPPRLRTLHRAIPRDLELVCEKAMEKRPEDRFVSARAFADELWRWLHDEPLRIRSITRLERSRRWARKHQALARVTVAAALVLFMVTTTLGWVAWWQGKQANDARLRAVEAEGQAELARARETLEAETRAELQVWALLDRARQRLRLPAYGRCLETQAILRQITEPRGKIPLGEKRDRMDLEARSLFAATLGLPDFQVVQKTELPPIPFYVWPVALHPNGEAMVIGTPKGPVRWIRGQQLQKPEVPDIPAERPRLAFSPDGRLLAFAAAEGGLELWDDAVTRVRAVLEPPSAGQVVAVGFTRRAETAWAVHVDGKVRSWSLADYQPGQSWEIPVGRPMHTRPTPQQGASLARRAAENNTDTSHLTRFTTAALNTDATLLAIGDEGGRVLLYQSNGQFLRELQSGRVEVTALAWSPDSKLVAVGSHDGSFDLWRADDGISLHNFPARGSEVSNLLFHPSGRWVLAGGRTVDTSMWEVASGEQVLSGPEVPWGVAANGRRLAFAGLRWAGFADLLIPQALRQLTGHRAHVEEIAWSRDNRHLVSLDSSFEVRVWNRDRLTAVEAFRPPPGSFFADNAAVAISDDGRLVAYAGGGECQALIWNVQTQALTRWKMSRGFDKLSYAGQNKFLLVRQEEVRENSREWQTVLRELEVGKPAPVVRVIRPGANGEKGVRGSGLTPDGKYYWWWGPRDPVDRRRLEVREVATGRLVVKVETPNNEPFGAYLSSDGRYLWVGEGTEHRQFDLQTNQPAQAVPACPDAYSPESRWMAYPPYSGSNQDIPVVSLRPWGEERPSLELFNMDLSLPVCPAFSPNGRYLAWGSQSGTITVADLQALQKEVGEFEEQGLSK